MPKKTKPIKLGTITRKQLAAYMSALGSRGGMVSAGRLTPAQRSERAKMAVDAREAKRKEFQQAKKEE